MRLTTKGRYAVTAMLDLAIHRDQGPISLADIATRQAISQSYLEQLFAKLRKNALVESVRGPGGGYKLLKGIEDIYVADIIDAVDEKVDATHCGGKGNCHEGAVCLTHHLWSDLNDEISQFLGSISLHKLLARKDIQGISEKQQNQQAQLKAESLFVSEAKGCPK